MGCLNSEGKFKHWFGNIHLSGPCNAQCYFCIGQHMMALDKFNNLDVWPLQNLSKFIDSCNNRSIGEINLTGTNTDPLLYKHIDELHRELSYNINSDFVFGIRTNGIAAIRNRSLLTPFDKISFSIPSFNPRIYEKIMGVKYDEKLRDLTEEYSPKVNVVLCPETVEGHRSADLWNTIYELSSMGIKKINLREPYGQPRIGYPMEKIFHGVKKNLFGMPVYQIKDTEVTYWDVHYVEVESVNLYANGIVSETYPITKGHHETGTVKDQSHFKQGRQVKQWQV